MSILGITIRTIRRRLKQTMTEFAELIGTDQSTVSRYESGRIVPSKTTLIVLLLLCREEEKAPILAAMGEVDEHALRTRFEGAQETLGALLPRHRQARRSSAVELKRIEFAEESAAIMSSGQPIEPALVEIIKLCRNTVTIGSCAIAWHKCCLTLSLWPLCHGRLTNEA